MALAIDTTSTGETTGTDAVSWSHTCTGSSLKLVVAVCWREGTGTSPTVSDITYTKGGTATSLTYSGVRAQINYNTDNYMTTEMWYMDAPDTGTHTVSVTLSEANDTGEGLAGFAISFTGSATGLGANKGTGTGNSDNPSTTFTTGASTSIIVVAIAQHNDGATFTADGTESEIYDTSPGTGSFWFATDTASGGSDTESATCTSSNRWAIMAVEVPQAAGGDINLDYGSDNLAQWKQGVKISY